MEKALQARANSACELCQATEGLSAYQVPPKIDGAVESHVLLCNKCRSEIEDPGSADANHWRCLNDSMWNTEPAVQVVAYRMLHHLRAEGWPQDLLDMMYMDDDTAKWARSTINEDGAPSAIHQDSNGVKLEAGDSVVLIKDLNVKGAGFTAKRGTAVRNITLVHDNPEHIEGRVNGQQIVILTQYVKKS